MRDEAGVAAGDEVDVEVELDDTPREVTLPPALAEALDAHPDAKEAFGELSYSNQRRHVLAVEGAKAEDTRQRRVNKILDELGRG